MNNYIFFIYNEKAIDGVSVTVAVYCLFEYKKEPTVETSSSPKTEERFYFGYKYNLNT